MRSDVKEFLGDCLMEFKCFFLKCELNGGKGKEGNISAKNFAYIMSWELWMENYG